MQFVNDFSIHSNATLSVWLCFDIRLINLFQKVVEVLKIMLGSCDVKGSLHRLLLSG
jgi:hypothetical protein